MTIYIIILLARMQFNGLLRWIMCCIVIVSKTLATKNIGWTGKNFGTLNGIIVNIFQKRNSIPYGRIVNRESRVGWYGQLIPTWLWASKKRCSHNQSVDIISLLRSSTALSSTVPTLALLMRGFPQHRRPGGSILSSACRLHSKNSQLSILNSPFSILHSQFSIHRCFTAGLLA